MTKKPQKPLWRRIDLAIILGVPAALSVVLLAQRLEGAPIGALWQPTAALVVFGGTLAAVVVSFPFELVRRTAVAVAEACLMTREPLEPVLKQLLEYSQFARRKGVIALEGEIERASSPFLRTALGLAIDGTTAKASRQILEAESLARREHAEGPADVLETAAGYSPTLGILGAVLGLIHVMQMLSDPSKLGSGIAVAFVATVYGVGVANLVLLPLATRIRGLARRDEVTREVIIEGMSAIQEGLNPRLLEQKLRGYLEAIGQVQTTRKAA